MFVRALKCDSHFFILWTLLRLFYTLTYFDTITDRIFSLQFEGFDSREESNNNAATLYSYSLCITGQRAM